MGIAFLAWGCAGSNRAPAAMPCPLQSLPPRPCVSLANVAFFYIEHGHVARWCRASRLASRCTVYVDHKKGGARCTSAEFTVNSDVAPHNGRGM